MSTELIKKLRDALARVDEALSGDTNRGAINDTLWMPGVGCETVSDALLNAKGEADTYLATGGWVRVEDALPVVLEDKSRVAIWIAGTKPTTLNRVLWMRGDVLNQRYTHWRYAEPTPNPPEQTK